MHADIHALSGFGGVRVCCLRIYQILDFGREGTTYVSCYENFFRFTAEFLGYSLPYFVDTEPF